MLSALYTNFADYLYTTVTVDTSDDFFSSGLWMFIFGVSLAVTVVTIAATWSILKKAGRPGWAAIVPIYNTLQLIWTTGRPWWWFLLLMIPFVNIVVIVLLYYNLAKAFGKGIGYTLLLVLLPIIGFPMLAWGGATYRLKKPRR